MRACSTVRLGRGPEGVLQLSPCVTRPSPWEYRGTECGREPGMRESQLALDGRKRHADRFGGLFERQAAEVSLFDNPALTWIDRLQPLSASSRSASASACAPRPRRSSIRRLRPRRRASLPGARAPVDEQPAHDPRSHRQEMRRSRNRAWPDVDQFEVGVVDQPVVLREPFAGSCRGGGDVRGGEARRTSGGRAD